MTRAASASTPTRTDALRESLPHAVALLKHRRAAEIAAADLHAYLELNWLEWNGGSLRLTVTGANVCSQAARAAHSGLSAG